MRLIRTPLISLPTVFVEQSLRARFVYIYIYIVHTLCSYNYIVAGTNLRNGRPTIPSSCATSNRCSSFIAYNEVTCRIQCENVALPLRSFAASTRNNKFSESALNDTRGQTSVPFEGIRNICSSAARRIVNSKITRFVRFLQDRIRVRS